MCSCEGLNSLGCDTIKGWKVCFSGDSSQQPCVCFQNLGWVSVSGSLGYSYTVESKQFNSGIVLHPNLFLKYASFGQNLHYCGI